jgi:uncharacterized protein (TIGR03437 family)
MKTKLGVLMGAVLLALPAAAQLSQPFVYSIVNSASYGTNIAQGSIFVVYGVSLGPAQLVQANALPLPSQLGGTSISVTSGGTTLPCPMVYSSATAVAAVLPSSLPAGKASLSLTYNGQMTAFTPPMNIVASAVGLYTLTSSGLGTGVFTGLDGSVKTFAAPANNLDTITAWATGAGAVVGPDNVVPTTFPNFGFVNVFVGTQPVSAIYAGRSGCCVGLDQISFQVPATLSGCYVPVWVTSQGLASNVVSLAVSNSAPCSDTAPTIPVSLMNKVAAGQTVKVGAIAAGPVAVLRGLGFNVLPYLTQTLSALLHQKISQQEVAKLLHARETSDSRALARGMAKYAASYKALSPAGRAAVQTALSTGQQGAVADFGQFSSASTLAAALGGLFPSQGTCSALPQVPSWSASAAGLDAGSTLALSGQAGSWTMAPGATGKNTGQYQVLFGSTPSGPNLPVGSYTVTGGGGKDLNAFTATMKVTGNIIWTNKAAVSTVSRSQPLTVTWSGGSPGYVLVGGYVSSFSGITGFICAEDASKGTFTVPSFVLSLLPAANSGAGVFVSPHPLSHPVTIPGLDLAYFMDGSSDSKPVVFQ